MHVIPFVFIAMGRSGTTWMSEVMNRHPCVYSAGEWPCVAMKRSTSLNPNLAQNAPMNRWEDLLPSGAFFDLGTAAMPCAQFDGRWRHADGSPYVVCPGNNPNLSVRLGAAPKMRDASSCTTFAIGAKCQPDRDLNTTNTSAFEAMLRSQTPPARVVYMVRNNSLDWIAAAGGMKGAEGKAITVNATNLVKSMKEKIKADAIHLDALQAAAQRASVPFLTLKYEDVCVNRSALHTLFRFLEVAGDGAEDLAAIAKLAAADNDSHAKKHLRTHRQEIANYGAIEAALAEVGLSRYLRDEACSVTPAPSIVLGHAAGKASHTARIPRTRPRPRTGYRTGSYPHTTRGTAEKAEIQETDRGDGGDAF